MREAFSLMSPLSSSLFKDPSHNTTYHFANTVPSASTAAVMDTPQVIDQTVEYLRHLHDLADSDTELERRGYIVRQLTEAELERKERCSRCKRGEQKTRHSPPKSSRSTGQLIRGLVVVISNEAQAPCPAQT